MKDWSANQYLMFNDERSRPARDLISAISRHDEIAIKNIVDIGCGPGNSTELLQYYWPKARISGFDNSPDMIAKAKSRLPQIHFEIGDIESWNVPQDVDLLFSNAVFQWLPNHVVELQRLFGEMKNGAILAIQMPDNLNEPIHQAMIDVAQDPRWCSRIGNIARDKLEDTGVYYDALAPLACHIDLWHSIYNHVMDGHQAIVDWVKGAALRPFLAPLNDTEKEIFLIFYLDRIKKSYPVQKDGKILLRFPRFFIVLKK